MVLGKVKTRLAATVGDVAALEIYRELVAYTHAVCDEVKADKWLFFSDELIASEKTSYQHYHYATQSGKDLGARMLQAFTHCFDQGYEKVLIIGTDCAELSSEVLETAYKALDKHEVVIGPAADGGYYMLGMRHLYADLFAAIPWSTDQVLYLTEQALQKQRVSYQKLAVLSDIDNENDWNQYKHLIHQNNE